MGTEKKGPLLVLLSYVIWGALPMFWKLLQGVEPFYLLASRIVWSMVFLGVLIALTGRGGMLREVLRSRHQMGRLLLSGLFITANWGVFVILVNSNRILENSLGNYMVPLFSIVLGFCIFRERLEPLQWGAVALAAVGVVIVVAHYHRVPWLALIAGITFPAYSAVKKSVHCDGIVSVFCETLWMLVPALGYLIWAESQGRGAIGNLSGWELLLLPLSGVATSVPLWIFSKGMNYGTPMTVAGMIMFVSPTMQFVEGLLIYREAFDPVYGVLFGFVWTGIILFFICTIRQHRRFFAHSPHGHNGDSRA